MLADSAVALYFVAIIVVNVNKGLLFCWLNGSNSHSNICQWAGTTDCWHSKNNKTKIFQSFLFIEEESVTLWSLCLWLGNCIIILYYCIVIHGFHVAMLRVLLSAAVIFFSLVWKKYVHSLFGGTQRANVWFWIEWCLRLCGWREIVLLLLCGNSVNTETEAATFSQQTYTIICTHMEGSGGFFSKDGMEPASLFPWWAKDVFASPHTTLQHFLCSKKLSDFTQTFTICNLCAGNDKQVTINSPHESSLYVHWLDLSVSASAFGSLLRSPHCFWEVSYPDKHPAIIATL